MFILLNSIDLNHILSLKDRSGFFIESQKHPNSLELHLETAEKLVNQYGGIPSPGWLVKNGYSTFYNFFNNNRDKFKNFEYLNPLQNKSGKLKKYLELAKKLQQEHGEIPNNKWLLDNGYSSFVSYKRNYPEKFKSFKFQVITEKQIEEKNLEKKKEKMLNIANYLQEEYGFIPNNYWLSKNGYHTLMYFMRVNPDLFKSYKVQPPDVYEDFNYKRYHASRAIAKKLVREYGRIPSFGWLNENGLGNFANYLRDHLKLFNDFKIDWIDSSNTQLPSRSKL